MRRLLRTLIPTAVAGLSLFAFAVPGYAGSNGQKVKVYENSNIGSLCISGYNQDYSWVLMCDVASAAIYHTNSYGSYWWKLTTYLDYYGDASRTVFLGSNTCYVPEYQSGSDWWTCSSI